MVDRNSNYLIIGLGTTGTETARFLMNHGARVKALDSKKREHLSSAANELIEIGLRVETDDRRENQFEWADTVILSPGVSFNNADIRKFIEKGKEIISEVEFASRFIKKPVIGITGSNGKTTTCSLLRDVLDKNGFNVFLGGNIGTPLITIADSNKEFDYIIAELSSFQLQGIRKFKPQIAVILNISQNHLDHHLDFEEYVQAKTRIYINQDEHNWAVFNNEDIILRRIGETLKAKKIKFGTESSAADIYRKNKKIRTKNNSYDLAGIKLIGEHNLDNAMAVIAVSEITGCNSEITVRTITDFDPLPHRTELLGMYKGVKIYNDSKSTTPDSTLKAIKSFDSPVILILGGRDKGLDYKILNSEIKSRVKHVVLYGEARHKIGDQICSTVSKSMADNLEKATGIAVRNSSKGDSILFSPACSSFDMYSSYIERGKEFKRIVELL